MKIVLVEPLKISEEYIASFAETLQDLGHDFTYYKDQPKNQEDLVARVNDAEVVMIGNYPYEDESIRQARHLKYINVAFTGVDHIGREACIEQEISVSNAAGYATQAVAELTLGLTIDLLRMVTPLDKETRLAGDLSGLPLMRQEIAGKTVGIIGTGAIGLASARLFKAFGANLLAYNRSEKEEAKVLGIEYVNLDHLLKASDIISLHLPLTPETHQLINKNRLQLMKKGALLLNLGRGDLVDYKALSQALKQGQIGGAGLDVFEVEPPLGEDHPILSAPNTILTPHIGYLTQEAMNRRAQIAFNNTLSYLNGQLMNEVHISH